MLNICNIHYGILVFFYKQDLNDQKALGGSPESWPRGYKTFLCLTQLSMKFQLLIQAISCCQTPS